jgi:hypothetical protein
MTIELPTYCSYSLQPFSSDRVRVYYFSCNDNLAPLDLTDIPQEERENLILLAYTGNEQR